MILRGVYRFVSLCGAFINIIDIIVLMFCICFFQIHFGISCAEEAQKL